MEIKKEEEIEIVGTQYEGRAINHRLLTVGQKLLMKHQTDNVYDDNAIIILTSDDKELGFMPRGYASIYAPAMDSGRYNFNVEIIKTESSSERPILIVKVTYEFDKQSEEVEKNIIQFVKNIASEYPKRKHEYLKFIYLKTVNLDELIVSLNNIRLIHNLYSLSEDIISELQIEPTDSEYIPYNKEILLETIGELSADINDVLKKLRKAYNETIDIDDEEEYRKVQSEIREKIKKFRSYNELFTCYHKSVEEYVVIENSYSVDTSEAKSEIIENPAPTPETITDKSSYFTENDFFNWMVSDGSVSEKTAKIYISNIHSIEKLYQTIYGIRKNILGADSADDVKTTIETITKNNRYIHANQKRNNSFGYALSKFVQFANISVDGLKITNKTKNYQPPVSTESTESSVTTKTVDFENSKNCTNSKPCSLTFNGSKYDVKSWVELYTKFLTLLYNDYGYSEILKCFIGKFMFGRRIDFADKTYLHYLREAREISKGFFVEINLNAPGIINRIKRLMELCSIDEDNIVIEYNTHEKNEDDVKEEPVVSEVPEDTEESTIEDELPFSAESYTDKPFILKDAVIELMSSDNPEIKKYRSYNNGIIPLTLCELIKKHYGKTVSIIKVSSLLRSDETFKFIGKGYYTLNIETPDLSEAEYTATMQKLAYTIKRYALTKYAMITDLTDTIKNYISIQENVSDTENITLSLNGNTVEIYDCFDALNKICEFAIRYKPFRMARISGANIQLNDRNVFYRSNIHVNNCKKLSNGIQIMRIDNITDLQTITDKVKKYCQIDDDMIEIISE